LGAFISASEHRPPFFRVKDQVGRVDALMKSWFIKPPEQNYLNPVVVEVFGGKPPFAGWRFPGFANRNIEPRWALLQIRIRSGCSVKA
jgi:hypothetical protein